MLTILLLLPFCGAALLALWPGASPAASRRTALAFVAAQFAGFVWLAASAFDPSKGGMQLAADLGWSSPLGFQFALAADGLSLLMMFLCSVVFIAALLTSRPETDAGKGYFSLLLLTLGGLTGVFFATDLFLWFAFWELVLIPLYFLIGLHGAEQRFKAADRFLLLSQSSAALIFLCIAALYFRSGAEGLAPTTHIFELQSQAVAWLSEGPTWLGLDFTSWLFALLGLSFFAIMGIFPFHGWMNSIFAQSSLPVGMVLLGVVSKVGAYAMLRLVFPIVPNLLPGLTSGLIFLSVVGVAYCGWAMLFRTNIRAKVSYGASSQMSLFLFGISIAASQIDRESQGDRLQALTGASFHLLFHSLVFLALLVMVQAFIRRDQDLDLPTLGGNDSKQNPPFLLTRGIWLFLLLPLGISFAVLTGGALAIAKWWAVLAFALSAVFLIHLGKAIGRLGKDSQNWQAKQLPAMDRWEQRPLVFLAGIAVLLLIPFFATDHIQATLNVILGSFSGGAS